MTMGFEDFSDVLIGFGLGAMGMTMGFEDFSDVLIGFGLGAMGLALIGLIVAFGGC